MYNMRLHGSDALGSLENSQIRLPPDNERLRSAYSDDVMGEGTDMKIEIKNLTKYYGDFRAVDSVSFSFSSGKLTALVGRNGSGKTTTIRTILGLLSMDEGELMIDGQHRNLNLKRTGYLAEDRGMFPKERVNEQLVFFGQLKGMTHKEADKSIDRWLEKLDIAQYKKSPLESLSKGNQQKIQMIASLIHDPDIIIFDEPFSGLDPVNMQMVMDLLRELRNEGKCILVSSHQLSLIEQVCEDICIIDRSRRIYYGTLAALREKTARKSDKPEISLQEIFLDLIGEEENKDE